MSKGSKRRPMLIDEETFESNWNIIFGKRKNEKPAKENKDNEPESSKQV